MNKLKNLSYLQWLRIIAGGLFILLILWLAISPRPTESKWQAISNELKNGTIGKISPEESRFLNETLSWLTPVAGVKGGFILDGLPKTGVLHVYVTTPAAVEVTGCARGNALYDAQLDAIFIDEELLNPKEIMRLGENSPGLKLSVDEYTFIPVYIRFILLHELGHRQLHRKSGGAFFDFNNGSKKKEQEADNFAIAKLKQAYALDQKTGGHRLGKSAAQFIQLDKENLSNAERVWVDLIGAAASMSLEMMYSASDFSSFYQDVAHPNFITRANSILTAGLAAKETGPDLKARAAIYLRYLQRMQSLPRFHFAEIQMPDGTQRVTFDSHQMLVLGSHGAVYQIPVNTVHNSFNGAHDPIRVIQPNAPTLNQKGNADVASMSKIWADPQSGVVILQPPPDEESSNFTVQGLKNGRLEELSSLVSSLRKASTDSKLFRRFRPWWNGGTDYDADVFLPPQPSATALLRSGDQTKLLILKKGQLSQTVVIDSLLKQIGVQLKQQASSFAINTVTDNTAYLTVFQQINGHDQLIGIAELNMATGRLGRALPLDFVDKRGNDMVSINGDKVVVVPGPKPRYILLTRNVGHFMLFELSTNMPAKPLTERNFLFDSVLIQHNINQDVMGSFDPYLTEARFVPPHYAVATFENDSVYFIDLNNGNMTTLFSPGNFLKMSVSQDGMLAFFVHNGRKIYVLKSSELL